MYQQKCVLKEKMIKMRKKQNTGGCSAREKCVSGKWELAWKIEAPCVMLSSGMGCAEEMCAHRVKVYGPWLSQAQYAASWLKWSLKLHFIHTFDSKTPNTLTLTFLAKDKPRCAWNRLRRRQRSKWPQRHINQFVSIPSLSISKRPFIKVFQSSKSQ